MASTYRLGPGSVAINGLGRPLESRFERAVRRTLDAVYRRHVGRTLLDWILSQRDRVLEVRLPPPGFSTATTPVARVRGATPRDEARSTQPGQGALYVLLEVHPRNYPDRDVYQATIIHELTHVVRWMSGTRTPTVTVLRYDNVEEFYGELLANMFWSEVGRPFPHSFGYSRGSVTVPAATSDPFWNQALRAVRGPPTGSAATNQMRSGQSEPAVLLNATQMRTISNLFRQDPDHGRWVRELSQRFGTAFPPLTAVHCPFNPFQ
jgi:hypothetical protein